jgi:acetamidase/formamidase
MASTPAIVPDYSLAAGRTAFCFRPDAEPALRVRPGAVVAIETSAAPVERLFAAGGDWVRASNTEEINAVTGPIFIEGVRPGDGVAVEILGIAFGSWGWNMSLPHYGLLAGKLRAPSLTRHRIGDGRVHLSDTLSVPLRPMIGCLGLAPAAGESSTLGPAYPWGGNMDLVQAKPGNTVLLPAQVPGGLFSLGDLHAAMGINEATFVAIEAPGVATVRLGVRPGLTLPSPRVESAERTYVTGFDPGPTYSLEAARDRAVDNLYAMLTGERGFSAEEAQLLIAAAADIELGGPACAIVLASVPNDVGMGV